jgi:hypothetical protein
MIQCPPHELWHAGEDLELQAEPKAILAVAIVPPHPTVLSLRKAVAIYVKRISTPDVHPEFPPLLGTLTGTLRHRCPRIVQMPS